MASCLGLYIESNIIKYAKVTKERDTIKVESFGIKFYDKLNQAIKQIVDETFSHKIPISINLSEEIYNYFYMFSLLSKKDLKKAIETEFEAYCYDKGLNKNAFEGRYAISDAIEDKDKLKIIYVSTNKTAVNKAISVVENAKVSTIVPMGTSIANIATIKPKENVIIVNIEEKTTITTIVNQKIFRVDKFEEGANDILGKINSRENSYSKAYEICKNSTIYTMENKDLQDSDSENEYLDDIMPTLYKIVNQLQDYIINTAIKFDKIYITGTMSAVNNIDLYFQEFFSIEKCEVLRPYFIKDNVKMNIKDYIEVNSAIALALQGLGMGIKSMNFKKESFVDIFPSLEINLGGKSGDKYQGKGFGGGINVKWGDLSTQLDSTEKWMLRLSAGILMLTFIYSGFTIYLNDEISQKRMEAQSVINNTKTQIALVESDTSQVRQKMSQYEELTDNLKSINQNLEEKVKTKDDVPDLLLQLMNIIPSGVQITEIENTAGKHIVIKVQSKQYEQLGYFKAKLKEDNILVKNTVVSTQGQKEGEFVKTDIEGDMP